MDVASLSLGVVAAVMQTYTAVTMAYDVYLAVKDFPTTYQEIRIGFLIERYRLEQWGNHVLSEPEQRRVEQSSHDEGLWKLFESVLASMFAAFQESTRTMENYNQFAGVPQKDGLAGSWPLSQYPFNDRASPDGYEDWELLDSMQIAVKSPTRKQTFTSFFRTAKFVLRDKKKMEDLIKGLCYWNDSLDKMTSPLEQVASRRRLRINFSSGDPKQLQHLEAAAVLLKHRDLEQMASARRVIEEGFQWEMPERPAESMSEPEDPPPNYRLEMNQLDFGQGIPFMTDQTRAMATFQGEGVLVDWRCCRDDTWRRQNPRAFRQRTANLTKILNSDLRPLNLGTILHCVGYLDQSSTVTGYAFRLPSDARPGQKPVTLQQLLTNVNKTSDVPDLGERFELAKALISTVFEIHNLGWMHKNIQPKHILFWPKPGAKDELNLSKPYLVGFDISRPNQPGEFSEKPLSNPEEDLYRHPRYKGLNPLSFLPSFDLYSLGVILYEIGIWRSVGFQNPRRGSRPLIETHHSDPQFIEKVVMSGPIMDLKRFMGARYRDAVAACLNMEFDAIWEGIEGDQNTMLKLYQIEVQTKVVDTISTCNA